MSVEQVNAFYDVLISDQAIYEEYLNKCCSRGFFGSYHWSKAKIVNFATKIGYKFTESDLDQMWFESEPSFFDNSLNLSEYGQLNLVQVENWSFSNGNREEHKIGSKIPLKKKLWFSK